MEFTVKSVNPETQASACLVITVAQPRKLSKTGQRLDKARRDTSPACSSAVTWKASSGNP